MITGHKIALRLCAIAVLASVLLKLSSLAAEPKFVLTPSFDISEIYDDNVFAASGEGSWDFYTEIIPSFRADLSLRLIDLSLEYGPSFKLFPRHFNDPGITEITHDLSFSAKTMFASGLIVSLEDNFGTVPFSYKAPSYSPSNMEQQNSLNVDAKYEFDVSQTLDSSISAGFTRSDATGQGTDGMGANGDFSFTKSFNSTISLELTNEFEKEFFDDITTDPFVYGIMVTPKVQLTGFINCSLGFGYRLLNLEGKGLENSFDYNLELGYVDDYENRLTVAFKQEFLTDVFGNPFDMNVFSLEISKPLLKRLTAGFDTSVSSYQDKATTGSGTSVILEISPSLEFDLGRDFSLNVEYNGFYNKWGSASDDYINNRFIITLSYEKSDEERY